MRRFRYKNYEHYMLCQIRGTQKKASIFSKRFFEENKVTSTYGRREIQKFFSRLNETNFLYKKMIFHGVRLGYEIHDVLSLNRNPEIKAIGTDISAFALGEAFKISDRYNANEPPHPGVYSPDNVEFVLWDFNKPNVDWIETFDVLYSNSLDHCYNPEETLNVWADQLISGGKMLIHHDTELSNESEVTQLDCVGFNDPKEIVDIAESTNKLKLNTIIDNENPVSIILDKI